jgi:RHS repeat-associated protein
MGNYTYGNPDHAHAVTATSGKSYGYDANGNQISRVIGSITYTLSYDVENRLVSVSWAIGSTNHSMTFVFDGDGSRVRSTLDGTTTTFAGTHYEVTGSAVTKYYYTGTSRIAMRSSIGLRYIFGDHPSTSLRTCLGSASVTADRYGSSVTRQLYKPFGETRSSGIVPTKYTFTGQYAYNGSGEIGLMYYVARFFDPQLGRFISADTIVPQPGSPLDWDRYLFVRGNPLRYSDPTGHASCDEIPDAKGQETCRAAQENSEKKESQHSKNPYVSTNAISLDGGPGAGSYSAKAEDSWTGFNGSGETSDPKVAGLIAAGDSLNSGLAWIRDNTLVREGILGGVPEVKGNVYYETYDYGFEITGVEIQNTSFETIGITYVYLETYSIYGDRIVSHDTLYPFSRPRYVTPNYGIAPSGSTSGIINISSGLIYYSEYVHITIYVKSASGRVGDIGVSLRVIR